MTSYLYLLPFVSYAFLILVVVPVYPDTIFYGKATSSAGYNDLLGSSTLNGPHDFKSLPRSQPPTVDTTFDFFTSPCVWFTIIASVCGVYWGERKLSLEKMNLDKQEKMLGKNFYSMERMLMHWHLSNATVWSCMFDALSGGLGVIPKVRGMYEVFDTRHTLDLDMRSGLDGIYFCEAVLHVPFSFLLFFLYATQHPARRLLEALVCGFQIVGAIAYYIPGAFDMGKFWALHDPALFIICTLGGGLWVVFPFMIFRRAWRLEMLLKSLDSAGVAEAKKA